MNLESLLTESKKFIKENKGYSLGATALITSASADIYATLTCIQDPSEEANPIGSFLFENYGATGLISFKLG